MISTKSSLEVNFGSDDTIAMETYSSPRQISRSDTTESFYDNIPIPEVCDVSQFLYCVLIGNQTAPTNISLETCSSRTITLGEGKILRQHGMILSGIYPNL
jgi:hypothetical protein